MAIFLIYLMGSAVGFVMMSTTMAAKKERWKSEQIEAYPYSYGERPDRLERDWGVPRFGWYLLSILGWPFFVPFITLSRLAAWLENRAKKT